MSLFASDGASLVLAFAHVVLAVVLVGYALFWTILALQERPGEEGFLAWLGGQRWPPRGMGPIGLSIWALGLGLALTLGLSGLMRLAGRTPTGTLWTLKGIGFALLLLVLIVFSRRPSRAGSFLLLVLSLGIVAVSALLQR